MYLSEPKIGQQWVPIAVDSDIGLGKRSLLALKRRIKATYRFEVAVHDWGYHGMEDIQAFTNTLDLRKV